ncbi:MAG: hypothetical protein HQ509_01055 [Candidatus Marinimicrobia bacterium]|nr:hypothetical protein [Candidatus Neomarinimicrobiota bacterium]
MIRNILLMGVCFTLLFGAGWEDYFHTAANHYTKSEKKKAAQIIQDGLYYYPNNPQLNALGGLLQDEEQEQQDQQSQNQEQSKEDQEKEEQEQKQDQQSQSEDEQQEQSEEEKQDKEEQQENQQSLDDEESEEEEPNPAFKENDEEKENDDQDKQNAAAILDALKDDEKILQKRQIAKKTSRKLEKDW